MKKSIAFIAGTFVLSMVSPSGVVNADHGADQCPDVAKGSVTVTGPTTLKLDASTTFTCPHPQMRWGFGPPQPAHTENDTPDNSGYPKVPGKSCQYSTETSWVAVTPYVGPGDGTAKGGRSVIYWDPNSGPIVKGSNPPRTAGAYYTQGSPDGGTVSPGLRNPFTGDRSAYQLSNFIGSNVIGVPGDLDTIHFTWWGSWNSNATACGADTTDCGNWHDDAGQSESINGCDPYLRYTSRSALPTNPHGFDPGTGQQFIDAVTAPFKGGYVTTTFPIPSHAPQTTPELVFYPQGGADCFFEAWPKGQGLSNGANPSVEYVVPYGGPGNPELLYSYDIQATITEIYVDYGNGEHASLTNNGGSVTLNPADSSCNSTPRHLFSHVTLGAPGHTHFTPPPGQSYTLQSGWDTQDSNSQAVVIWQQLQISVKGCFVQVDGNSQCQDIPLPNTTFWIASRPLWVRVYQVEGVDVTGGG